MMKRSKRKPKKPRRLKMSMMKGRAREGTRDKTERNGTKRNERVNERTKREAEEVRGAICYWLSRARWISRCVPAPRAGTRSWAVATRSHREEAPAKFSFKRLVGALVVPWIPTDTCHRSKVSWFIHWGKLRRTPNRNNRRWRLNIDRSNFPVFESGSLLLIHVSCSIFHLRIHRWKSVRFWL